MSKPTFHPITKACQADFQSTPRESAGAADFCTHQRYNYPQIIAITRLRHLFQVPNKQQGAIFERNIRVHNINKTIQCHSIKKWTRNINCRTLKMVRCWRGTLALMCLVLSSSDATRHPFRPRVSPIEQPARANKGYLRPYQRNKKKHVLTRTRQAY